MVLIEDAQNYVGTEIEGIFLLSNCAHRTDRYGRPYRYLVLEDRSGVLPAYAWDEGCYEGETFQTGTPIRALLRVRRLQDRPIAHVAMLSQTQLPPVNPIQLVPHRALPHPEVAARLQVFIDRCAAAPLQRFLCLIFSNPELAQSFLSAPASQSHHHAFPGGLAVHSLEVAETVLAVLDHEELSMGALAGVAGLLHDVGKIRLMKANGARTQAGYVLRHEALALELLAPALSDLDQSWPDGATALRYLLTWQAGGREARPLIPVALAIQFADRYSSARGARDLAFAGAPDWKRFARLETAGPVSRFWRPDTTRVVRSVQARLPDPAALQSPANALD